MRELKHGIPHLGKLLDQNQAAVFLVPGTASRHPSRQDGQESFDAKAEHAQPMAGS
jgi:hypothetical protein